MFWVGYLHVPLSLPQLVHDIARDHAEIQRREETLHGVFAIILGALALITGVFEIAAAIRLCKDMRASR